MASTTNPLNESQEIVQDLQPLDGSDKKGTMNGVSFARLAAKVKNAGRALGQRIGDNKLKTVGGIAALIVAVVICLALAAHFSKNAPFHNLMQKKIEPFFTHTMGSGLSKAWHATSQVMGKNTKLGLPVWGVAALAVGSYSALQLAGGVVGGIYSKGRQDVKDEKEARAAALHDALSHI